MQRFVLKLNCLVFLKFFSFSDFSCTLLQKETLKLQFLLPFSPVLVICVEFYQLTELDMSIISVILDLRIII